MVRDEHIVIEKQQHLSRCLSRANVARPPWLIDWFGMDRNNRPVAGEFNGWRSDNDNLDLARITLVVEWQQSLLGFIKAGSRHNHTDSRHRLTRSLLSNQCTNRTAHNFSPFLYMDAWKNKSRAGSHILKSLHASSVRWRIADGCAATRQKMS